MSLKTELKIHVLLEQGNKADDLLENAVRRQAAHDGAKQALGQAAKNIASLTGVVDKDLEEGKIPLDEPLKLVAYVKLMIDRASMAAMSSSKHQENLQIATGGEIAAYQALVASIKKELIAEEAKLVGQQEPDVARRTLGEHPMPSIAAQRRAEETPHPEVTTNGVVIAKNGKRGSKKKGK